jgi:hypothetical protein
MFYEPDKNDHGLARLDHAPSRLAVTPRLLFRR